MELLQAKGNTWYLADWQLIPIYKTDERHCILLDSGLISQREDIENTLKANGLTPIGILGTHAHTDHSPNHHYFREKYQIPVALSGGEAAISRNPLLLKAYYYMLSSEQLLSFEEYREMLTEIDRIICPEEESVSFCGAEFTIIPTSGHSPNHIAIGTPDGVLYLGDAVLSGASLTESKLPYFFSIADAFRTMEKLGALIRGQTAYDMFITAHRGIHTELTELLSQNIETVQNIADKIAAWIDRPMTISEAIGVICENLSLLSSRVRRSTYYERNIRTYLEYLTDTGKIEMYAKRGVTGVRPMKQPKKKMYK